jgi:NDP-sugar pyrophosphorylase family protein
MMKAMILAAGLGTRLRPLTLERAKPAVPLMGKPLILRLIEYLCGQGVTRFRLNLHHLPDTITRLFSEGRGTDPAVSFSLEPRILGTAGGLKSNESFFDSGTFLMANGDIVTDSSLERAMAFHRKKGALATLILKRQTPPFVHYPVRIDADGRLVGFKGRSQGDSLALPDTFVFTGIHILEPDIFSFIPSETYFDINDGAYPAAMDAGREVFGFRVEGYWNDVGAPAAYLRAHFDLLAVSGEGGASAVDGSAKLSAGAKIGPRAIIGPECVVEDGAQIVDSVLWDRVVVRSGVTVRGCVIGAGAVINASAYSRVITLNGEAPIG